MTITGPAIATIIVSVFGCVWCLYACAQLPTRSRSAIALAGVLVAAVLVAAGIAHTRVVAKEFVLPIYFASVAFEAIAIASTVAIMRRSNQVTLIGPIVAIIVGLHFIGLLLAMQDPLFLYLCVALCVVGVVAALRAPAMRAVVAGFGSAGVLWLSAIVMIAR